MGPMNCTKQAIRLMATSSPMDSVLQANHWIRERSGNKKNTEQTLFSIKQQTREWRSPCRSAPCPLGLHHAIPWRRTKISTAWGPHPSSLGATKKSPAMAGGKMRRDTGGRWWWSRRKGRKGWRLGSSSGRRLRLFRRLRRTAIQSLSSSSGLPM